MADPKFVAVFVRPDTGGDPASVIWYPDEAAFERDLTTYGGAPKVGHVLLYRLDPDPVRAGHLAQLVERYPR